MHLASHPNYKFNKWSVPKLLKLVFLKEYYFDFCSFWFMLSRFMYFMTSLFKWEHLLLIFCQILYYHLVIYQEKVNTMNWSPWFCNLMYLYTKRYKEQLNAFWLAFKSAYFQCSGICFILAFFKYIKFSTQNGIVNANEFISVKSIFFKLNKVHTSYYESI